MRNQIFEKLLSHLHVFVALTNLPGGTKSSFCAGSRPPRFFLSAGLWKYFVALWRLLFPTCGRDDRFTLALTPLCGLGEQKDYLVRPEQFIFRLPASCRRSQGTAAVKQGGKNQDVKKPQFPEDHPQIVASAAQHRMNRITERALEPVPPKFAVRLHVPNGRFNRASSSNDRAQGSGDSFPQPRAVGLYAFDNSAPVAAFVIHPTF